MKNIFKFFALATIVFSIQSCEEGDQKIDDLFDTVERGAILRTVETVSNELPIGIDTAAFEIVIEEQDEEDGDLLESVEVFGSFQDNSEDDGDTTGANLSEFPLGTIPASEFMDGPFGLPRTTIRATLTELAANANVSQEDLFGGDTFTIRLVLNLTDGRSITNTDVNGNVASGSFFLSPFIYTATVTCPIEEGYGLGTYFVTNTGAVFPDFGATTNFEEGAYNIVLGEGDTARIIEDLPYLPEFGSFVGPLRFNLVCGSTALPLQNPGGGVGCGGAIQAGSFGSVFGTYDPTDDSVIQLNFTVTAGDSGSTCPSADHVAGLLLTKQ